MTTDEEIKALVEKLRSRAGPVRMDNGCYGDLLAQAADTIEALTAKVAEQTIQLRVVRLHRDGAVKRLEAAEKRLAEAEAVQKAKDDQYWLVAENEAKLQEHCDRLEGALRAAKQRFIQIENCIARNLFHQQEKIEDAKSVATVGWCSIDAALSGSSDPRKDVARRCVDIAQAQRGWAFCRRYWGDAVKACDNIASAISREFSLDTKEGTDA